MRKSKMYDMIEELREAANTSASQTEVLRKLGFSPQNAGNHKTLKRVAKEFGIALPNGTGTAIATSRIKKSLDEILVLNGSMSSYNLKKRLLKENIFDNKCSAPFCPVPNPSIDPWTGNPAPLKLALDHINGDNTDNRLENLRLLCYHCHGLTDTYCRGSK